MRRILSVIYPMKAVKTYLAKLEVRLSHSTECGFRSDAHCSGVAFGAGLAATCNAHRRLAIWVSS